MSIDDNKLNLQVELGNKFWKEMFDAGMNGEEVLGLLGRLIIKLIVHAKTPPGKDKLESLLDYFTVGYKAYEKHLEGK